MLKKRAGRKFSRNTNSRRAMFRSLVRNLILKGSIETSLTKAKAVSPMVDNLFTKIKTGSLSDKRSILATLANDVETFEALQKRHTEAKSERTSGFTKLTKIQPRRGDNSPMVRFELSEA